MNEGLLVRGGPIWTGETFVAALAADRTGRVVAAGPESHARAAAPSGARTIDLAGRLGLPGFADAHTHLLGAGLLQSDLALADLPSPEACAEAVARRARDLPSTDWILGHGWDPDRFPGGAWPDRAALDRAAPRHPVFLLRRDGHAAWVNTRALERAGLLDERRPIAGGEVVRDAAGAPTGILLEDPAIDRVRLLVPPPSLEARIAAAERGLARLREQGITSVEDDASYDDRLAPGEVYGALLERGRLTARVRLWQRLGRPLDAIRAERAARPSGPLLAWGLLKGYLDGSLGSRTALLDSPYADAPETSGIPLLDAATLAARVGEAHAAGFQIGLHTIGDRAVREALDAFEALGDPRGVRRLRHRIEHAQVFRPADVARPGRLGVVASVQPVHLASDRAIAVARLGRERAASSYVWRSLLDAGAPLAFGTDYPVEGLDPIRGLACAVRRVPPGAPASEAFLPEQALELPDALAAYTRGSAFAAHAESERGRLVPGQHADLVVLTEDLFHVPPDRWGDVRAGLTVTGGRVVFER